MTLTPAQKAAIVAALTLVLGIFGLTVVPSNPPSSTPAPGSSKYAACVAPSGMTALIDQDKSDSQKPWRIPPGSDHAEVWFNAAPLDAKAVQAGWTQSVYLDYLRNGRDVWNQSPCLDVHVVQLEGNYRGLDQCPAGKNCVPIVIGDGGGDDGNFNARESDGFTIGGDIQVLRKLSANTDSKGCNERKNVVAHEMGHAVGLVHRRGRVLMNGDTYGDICTADPDEYRNLLFDYGRQIRR
jgi:hypothetical protein